MSEHDTEPTAPPPSLDDAALDRLRRFGGGKLLGQMIAIYLEAAPQRIEAARDGVARGDAKAVEMALHSLKSSSAQLGAMDMQKLCERGERAARDGQLGELSPIITSIDEQYPLVVRWLERARTQETT